MGRADAGKFIQLGFSVNQARHLESQINDVISSIAANSRTNLISITSATYADYTNMSVQLHISDPSEYVLAFASIRCSHSNDQTAGELKLVFNNIDVIQSDRSWIAPVGNTSGAHGTLFTFGLVVGTSPGTYTLKGQWRNPSGVGTFYSGANIILGLVI